MAGMKAELMSFGFIVGGPHDEVWVPTKDEVSPAIANMMVRDHTAAGKANTDRDDYTATEVFAKVWRGAVLNAEGNINFPATKSWDEAFKEQAKE